MKIKKKLHYLKPVVPRIRPEIDEIFQTTSRVPESTFMRLPGCRVLLEDTDVGSKYNPYSSEEKPSHKKMNIFRFSTNINVLRCRTYFTT